jgi:recombination protein RecA
MTLPLFTDDSEVADVRRVRTGLYSVDMAHGFQGQHGITLNGIHEFFGRQEVGKSTLAYYLAGCVDPEGTVVLIDLENSLDPNYVPVAMSQSGFKGVIKVVNFVERKKDEVTARPHEKLATEGADLLLRPEVSAIVLDSVGLFQPIQEREGEIGEAIIGRRARAVAQFVRRCETWLLAEALAGRYKVVLVVNHVLSVVGGRGHYSPGGDTKNFAFSSRNWMYRVDSQFPDGCFQAEIKLEKLRRGGTHKDRKGIVFIIPGIGVARGMTAMLDCVRLGIAKRGTTVKIGDKSVGRISTLIKHEMDGNYNKFKPFFEELEAYESTN